MTDPQRCWGLFRGRSKAPTSVTAFSTARCESVTSAKTGTWIRVERAAVGKTYAVCLGWAHDKQPPRLLRRTLRDAPTVVDQLLFSPFVTSQVAPATDRSLQVPKSFQTTLKRRRQGELDVWKCQMTQMMFSDAYFRNVWPHSGRTELSDVRFFFFFQHPIKIYPPCKCICACSSFRVRLLSYHPKAISQPYGDPAPGTLSTKRASVKKAKRMP